MVAQGWAASTASDYRYAIGQLHRQTGLSLGALPVPETLDAKSRRAMRAYHSFTSAAQSADDALVPAAAAADGSAQDEALRLDEFRSWMVAQGWAASTASDYRYAIGQLHRQTGLSLGALPVPETLDAKSRRAMRAYHSFTSAAQSADDAIVAVAVTADGSANLNASARQHEMASDILNPQRKRRRVTPTLIDDSGPIVLFTPTMQQEVCKLFAAKLTSASAV